MKMVAAATVAALALMGSALSASAATMPLAGGPFADGDAPNIGTGKASTGMFSDTYTFMLTGTNMSFSVNPQVVLSVVTPRNIVPTASVTNFTLSLLQGSTLIDTIVLPTAVKGSKLSLTDDGLLANTAYSLVVSGTVNAVANNKVSYGGSMPVVGVSTVPLPTSVALFGTAVMGLGLAGAARRKSAKAAAAL